MKAQSEQTSRTLRWVFVALAGVSSLCSNSCGEEAPLSEQGPCADAGAPQRFRATFGGAAQDEGTAVSMRSDGTLLVGGAHEVDGTPKAWVEAIDATGATVWRKYWDGNTVGALVATEEVALAVERGFKGRLLSTTGDELWSKSWSNGQGADYEIARAATAFSDGFLVVGEQRAGTSANASRKARLVRLQKDGGVQWDRQVGSDGQNTANAVVAVSADEFLTVGHAAAPISAVGRQLWLRAADADGTELWMKRHGGPLEEIGVGVAVNGKEGFIIASSTRSKGAGESDLWLIGTDQQGNIKWDVTFGGEANDEPKAMAQLADGSVVITGRYTSEETMAGGLWLVRASSVGKLLWERAYGLAWKSKGSAIGASGTEVAVVGTSSLNGAGGDDAWLLRTGPSGDAWCEGNRGAPCTGPEAHSCAAPLSCDKTTTPPVCGAAK